MCWGDIKVGEIYKYNVNWLWRGTNYGNKLDLNHLKEKI